jgi:hypothetical protein
MFMTAEQIIVNLQQYANVQVVEGLSKRDQGFDYP